MVAKGVEVLVLGHLGSIYNIYFSKFCELRTQGIGLPSGFWDVTCDGCDGIAARILKCSEAREGLIVGKDGADTLTDVFFI